MIKGNAPFIKNRYNIFYFIILFVYYSTSYNIANLYNIIKINGKKRTRRSNESC